MPSAQSSALVNLLPIFVVFAIFYFLAIRPQQKQAKEHRRKLDALKNGDKVLTQGGIYGTVVTLKGSTVVLKIAENVKVDVARSSIADVLLETTNGAPTSPKEVVS